jgi:glycosyltransferase involved in cell wall biosynthesis
LNNNKINTVGILAFVPDYWSSIRQSRHFILEMLSERYKILWVNPPQYFESQSGFWIKQLFRRRVKKIHGQLWQYTAIFPCDYKRNYNEAKLIGKAFVIYRNLWRSTHRWNLLKSCKFLGIDETIAYIWRPDFSWVLDGNFQFKYVCYHIDDEYSFNTEIDVPISINEYRLLRQANLVFIHSKTLLAKKGHINKNTFEIPNGVDIDLFGDSVCEFKELPDIDTVKAPIIGYVGNIKKHIDLELILQIASLKMDWQFVFVGPIRENHLEIHSCVLKLKKLNNVHFLGPKPYDMLPFYIKKMDVCIMPYVKSEYTKFIYPMKMHEYFACGKPVVSTYLDNLQEFENYLYFADGVNDWVRKIEMQLLLQNENRILELKNFATTNSWQNRVSKILGIWNDHFNFEQCES